MQHRDAMTTWCGSGEQISYFSRKPYRGGNRFLLGLMGKPPGAWGTYRQFAEEGYQVAKGERAGKVGGEPGWLVELERPAAYGFA